MNSSIYVIVDAYYMDMHGLQVTIYLTEILKSLDYWSFQVNLIETLFLSSHLELYSELESSSLKRIKLWSVHWVNLNWMNQKTTTINTFKELWIRKVREKVQKKKTIDAHIIFDSVFVFIRKTLQKVYVSFVTKKE